MKKISIIGTVGVPANYGGWETLAEHLIKNNEKIDFTIYCSAKKYKNKINSYYGARVKYINLNANGWQSIPYDLISMVKAGINKNDILMLGVSGGIFIPLIKKIFGIKIYANIDGVESRRQKWGKIARAFLRISEKVAVKYSDIVIADNKGITEYVKEKYNRDALEIPYGGDHASKIKLKSDIQCKYGLKSNEYAFKVARIEKENNIDLILEAFSLIQEVQFVIIGNWNNSIYGIELRKKYSNKKNIIILDPIYNLNILDQIRSNCRFYVHGHSAGGTNPSLVEAMSIGLPCVCFDVNFNRYTTHGSAIYFKDKNELVSICKKINNDDEGLYLMGEKLRKIARENYKWDKISKSYYNLLI